jgi:HEPN domain-containing protein
MVIYATQEELEETFMEVTAELKMEINKLSCNQRYLEVFEGNDVYDPITKPTKIQEIIMHLYMEKVAVKYDGWVNPHSYKATEYTEMYRKVIQWNYRNDFLQSYHKDEDSHYGEEQNVEEEEDWEREAEIEAMKRQVSTGSHKENQLTETTIKVETSSDVAAPGTENVPKEYVQELNNKYELEKEPALDYAHLAMCEYTLIQSHDDLKCAETLLCKEHYPQAVFMCTQSVEKSLKSILRFFKYYFFYYINRHSATELVYYLKCANNQHPDTPYSKHHSKFQELCEMFESLGAEGWVINSPLSIRSRYFNFQMDWSPGSRFHFYSDSYPGVVFTKDVSQSAYAIAKEIFELTENIHEENLLNFYEEY